MVFGTTQKSESSRYTFDDSQQLFIKILELVFFLFFSVIQKLITLDTRHFQQKLKLPFSINGKMFKLFCLFLSYLLPWDKFQISQVIFQLEIHNIFHLHSLHQKEDFQPVFLHLSNKKLYHNFMLFIAMRYFRFHLFFLTIQFKYDKTSPLRIDFQYTNILYQQLSCCDHCWYTENYMVASHFILNGASSKNEQIDSLMILTDLILFFCFV